MNFLVLYYYVFIILVSSTRKINAKLNTMCYQYFRAAIDMNI